MSVGRIGNSNQFLQISGVVSAPAYSFASDNNTGMYRIGADNIGFAANNATILTVDGSTASSATGLQIKSAAAAAGVALSVTSSGTNEDIFIDPKGNGGIVLCNNSTGYVEVRQTTNGLLGSYVRNNSTGTAAYSTLGVVSSTGGSGELRHNGSSFTTSGIYQQNGTMLLGSAAGGLTVGTAANQPVYFAQNNAEAARITTTKNLLVGATADTSSPTSRILATTANDGQLGLNATTSGNSVYTSLTFFNQGTRKADIFWLSTDTRLYAVNGTGGVYLATNDTTWTSNSDERLKTDLQNIENAAEKVSSLRAVTGRYLTDESEKRRAFLIAQDVQSVLPEAVNADNPDALGVAYTDVIPLLVAAIKELKARIEIMENN